MIPKTGINIEDSENIQKEDYITMRNRSYPN